MEPYTTLEFIVTAFPWLLVLIVGFTFACAAPLVLLYLIIETILNRLVPQHANVTRPVLNILLIAGLIIAAVLYF